MYRYYSCMKDVQLIQLEPRARAVLAVQQEGIVMTYLILIGSLGVDPEGHACLD